MEATAQEQNSAKNASRSRSPSQDSQASQKIEKKEETQPPREPEDDEVFEVFIGELSYDAEEEDVRKHFRDCEDIISVKLLYRMDGKPKGKGFIKFGSRKAMEKALDLHDSDMMGRRIVVEKPANPTVRRDNGFANKNTQESKSIIVRNLPFRMEEDDLFDAFEEYGKIRGHKIVKNHDGRSKGFGFVDFDTVEDARAALEKDGAELQGRVLRVEFSVKKDRGFGGGYRREGGYRYNRY